MAIAQQTKLAEHPPARWPNGPSNYVKHTETLIGYGQVNHMAEYTRHTSGGTATQGRTTHSHTRTGVSPTAHADLWTPTYTRYTYASTDNTSTTDFSTATAFTRHLQPVSNRAQRSKTALIGTQWPELVDNPITTELKPGRPLPRISTAGGLRASRHHMDRAPVSVGHASLVVEVPRQLDGCRKIVGGAWPACLLGRRPLLHTAWRATLVCIVL